MANVTNEINTQKRHTPLPTDTAFFECVGGAQALLVVPFVGSYKKGLRPTCQIDRGPVAQASDTHDLQILIEYGRGCERVGEDMIWRKNSPAVT